MLIRLIVKIIVFWLRLLRLFKRTDTSKSKKHTRYTVTLYPGKYLTYIISKQTVIRR
jgi:hypothetical protein